MDNNKWLLSRRLDLGGSPNWFTFLELFFFALHIFYFFYPRINKSSIHIDIIGISSSQNGPSDLFRLTGVYFESKVIEGLVTF